MPVSRRSVPKLPSVPRLPAIANDMRRSYSTGRQAFTRAFVGSPWELTLTTPPPGQFPKRARAQLVTTLNSTSGQTIDVPFTRTDDSTFTCRLTPQHPGLHSFWARFSLDGGKTWTHDRVPNAWVLVDPAQVDQVRLYTLIPAVSGTIADWANALAGIKEMGFNTIHLLPLTTQDTSQSPYSAHDLFQIDPGYLNPGDPRDGLTQLEDFIQKARALDLQLCFDLVFNHVGTSSNIATRAPEWIVPDPLTPDGNRRAHYWCDKGWLPWNDLVLIDYEHPSPKTRDDIHAYMTQYALFWAQYASQTNGFIRFDNLHSSDRQFVDTLTQTLRKKLPNVGVIAEYFTDSSTLLDTIPKWNLSLILATPWDSRFVPQLRTYLKYLHSISDHVRFFMPISSHDSGTPAQEFASVEATIPRYVAAALLGTGATGITQGVEWGAQEKINFIGRHPRIELTAPPRFAPFLRRVNDILAGHPAFRCGPNCDFIDGDHHAIIAVFRKAPPQPSRPGHAGYLVVCNFDIFHEQHFAADLTSHLGNSGIPIHAVDLLSGESRTFSDARLHLVLPPCSACVLQF